MSSLRSLSSSKSKAEEQYEAEKSAPIPATSDPEKQLEQVNTTKPSDEVEWVTGPRLWIITAGLTLVCFLNLLDTSILVTAIPKITTTFHSLSEVGWYGAAYQLASAVLQPLTGKIYRHFNIKWTFIFFFAIFEIGSLLCGVAVSSTMLIVGRAIAGIGTSGVQNGAFTIIAACVPLVKRPAYFGIVMGCAQLGLVSGPLFGGLLTEYSTWRWCFYLNLPCGGAVAALLLFTRIPDVMVKERPLVILRTLHRKLDLMGFAIFAPAIVMLLLAVIWGGNTYAWSSATIIGLFCGAGVTFILWLFWNFHKKDDGLIPWPLIRIRYVWSSCLVMLFFAGSMFTTSYYLPIYFQGVKAASPAMSGVYLLPSIGSQIIGAMSSGKLVSLVGYQIPFSIASAVFTAIGYGLLSTFTPGTPIGQWVGFQILFGIGRGIGLQMPLVAVQSQLQPQQIAVATALIMFSMSMGGALFLSFSDTIFTNSLRELLPKYAPDVDAQAVVAAGAYGFRKVVPETQLHNVLVAYTKSIDRIFYLLAAMACLCFIFSWLTGWIDLRKAKSQNASSSSPSEKTTTERSGSIDTDEL